MSTDRATWQGIAEQAELDGQPYEATFDPVATRYVRVCALKPDGPEQVGSQMSVAELEVYE